MAAVRHLRFIGRTLGPRMKSTLGGLYRRAKFGWNRCSSFDNTKVLIFCAHPTIGVFEGFDPEIDSIINDTPNAHPSG